MIAGISSLSFPGQPDRSIGAARLQQALAALNQAQIFGANRELTFVTDPVLRRPVIRVIDRETHETVAQLPPEYVVRLAASLQNGTNKQ